MAIARCRSQRFTSRTIEARRRARSTQSTRRWSRSNCPQRGDVAASRATNQRSLTHAGTLRCATGSCEKYLFLCENTAFGLLEYARIRPCYCKVIGRWRKHPGCSQMVVSHRIEGICYSTTQFFPFHLGRDPSTTSISRAQGKRGTSGLRGALAVVGLAVPIKKVKTP